MKHCIRTALLASLAVITLLVPAAATAENQEEQPALRVNPELIRTRQPALSTDAAARIQPATTAVQPDRLQALLGSNFTAKLVDPQSNTASQISTADIARLDKGQYVALTADTARLSQLSSSAGRDFKAVPMLIVTRRANDTLQSLRLDRFSHGFAWKEKAREFTADLFLALHDLDDTTSSDRLDTPVIVRVGGAGLAGGEQQVRIERLGFAGEKQLELRSAGRQQPVNVTLRSAVEDAERVAFEVDIIDVPRVQINAIPRAIAGYGIEKTSISINSNDYFPAGFQLDLASSAGTLDPQTVTFDASGRAVADLWSARTGEAQVSIADERFEAEPIEVVFLPPLGFITACLLGALLGAVCYYAIQRARHPDKASAWSGIAAFLFSLVITVAVYAGFEIPKMLDLPEGRTGLVVVFATAALAAILCNTILSAMTGKGADAGAPSG